MIFECKYDSNYYHIKEDEESAMRFPNHLIPSLLMFSSLLVTALASPVMAAESRSPRHSCAGTYQGMPLHKIANVMACSNKGLKLIPDKRPAEDWGRPSAKGVKSPGRSGRLPQMLGPKGPAADNWAFPAHKQAPRPAK